MLASSNAVAIRQSIRDKYCHLAVCFHWMKPNLIRLQNEPLSKTLLCFSKAAVSFFVKCPEHVNQSLLQQITSLPLNVNLAQNIFTVTLRLVKERPCLHKQMS